MTKRWKAFDDLDILTVINELLIFDFPKVIIVQKCISNLDSQQE